MKTVGEVLTYLLQKAPLSLAESWDNCGLLVGSKQEHLKGVLLALDVNDRVIDHAIETGVNLIITHHPLIFKPVKKVSDEDLVGNLVWRLASNKISLITLHTNLDSCTDGTNDVVINMINLPLNRNVSPIEMSKDDLSQGLGRLVHFDTPVLFTELQQNFKNAFRETYIVEPFNGCPEYVNRIAICTGSGSSLTGDLLGKCDVYITGDITYHDAQFAQNAGLPMLVFTHYESEVPVLRNLKIWLSDIGVDADIMADEKKLRVLTPL